MGFLLRLLANMAALAVATWIFSGISLTGSDTDLEGAHHAGGGPDLRRLQRDPEADLPDRHHPDRAADAGAVPDRHQRLDAAAHLLGRGPARRGLAGRRLLDGGRRRHRGVDRQLHRRTRSSAPRSTSVPDRPVRRSIVFVCWGNICRSPMAERVAEKLAADRGLDDLVFTSAATSREEIGAPIDDRAVEVLSRHGYRTGGHAAHQITRAEIESADLVLAMENIHLTKMRAIAPGRGQPAAADRLRSRRPARLRHRRSLVRRRRGLRADPGLGRGRHPGSARPPRRLTRSATARSRSGSASCSGCNQCRKLDPEREQAGSDLSGSCGNRVIAVRAAGSGRRWGHGRAQRSGIRTPTRRPPRVRGRRRRAGPPAVRRVRGRRRHPAGTDRPRRRRGGDPRAPADGPGAARAHGWPRCRQSAERRTTPEDRAARKDVPAGSSRPSSSRPTGWWLDRMVRAEQPTRERLTWFWHGHFATSAQKVRVAALMLRQNETFRDRRAGVVHRPGPGADRRPGACSSGWTATTTPPRPRTRTWPASSWSCSPSATATSARPTSRRRPGR